MKIFKKLRGIGIALALLLTLGQIPAALAATAPIEQPVALFETALQSQISSSATTMTLSSGTTLDGTTLSGTYSFTLSEGNPDQEFVRADCTNTTCTNLERGISVVTGTTTIPALEFTHRRGTSVKITDAPVLMNIARILNGVGNFPNVLSYLPTTSTSTLSGAQIPSVAYLLAQTSTASTSAISSLLGGNNTWLGTNAFNALTTFGAGFIDNASTTFTNTTNVRYSTASSSAASVGYVNDIAIAGSPNASEIAKGIVEIATKAEASLGTGSGSTGALLVLPASMATSTSQVATTSLVMTNTLGKIDSSFLPSTSAQNLVTTYTAATAIAQNDAVFVIPDNTATSTIVANATRTSTTSTSTSLIDGTWMVQAQWASGASTAGPGTTYRAAQSETRVSDSNGTKTAGTVGSLNYTNSSGATRALLMQLTANGTIAFDAAGTGLQASGSTLTFTHVTAGSNRALIMALGVSGGAPTAVTYNGVAMTQILSTPDGGSAADYLYFLANPTLGSNTVSITNSGSTRIEAATASYTGVSGFAVQGTNAGSIAKASSASFDSSGTFVGFASAAINAAATGNITIDGTFTGLSGLGVGRQYYLSDTAGTISSTAGTFSRKVGISNSATSLNITNNF